MDTFFFVYGNDSGMELRITLDLIFSFFSFFRLPR
jgi:hypothetical protein